MSWRVVKRRLGRAGGVGQRRVRQAHWDKKYGDGNWDIGYVIEGEFVSQLDAFERVYVRSYADHFERHPADLEELVRTAKVLRNPHALATTGVDLQVPAVLRVLSMIGCSLEGAEVVDIGSWKNQASHALSIRLSPLQIGAHGNPRLTLEKFWQSKKCLVVWDP